MYYIADLHPLRICGSIALALFYLLLKKKKKKKKKKKNQLESKNYCFEWCPLPGEFIEGHPEVGFLFNGI
jgi:hypothetical protein